MLVLFGCDPACNVDKQHTQLCHMTQEEILLG